MAGEKRFVPIDLIEEEWETVNIGMTKHMGCITTPTIFWTKSKRNRYSLTLMGDLPFQTGEMVTFRVKRAPADGKAVAIMITPGDGVHEKRLTLNTTDRNSRTRKHRISCKELWEATRPPAGLRIEGVSGLTGENPTIIFML